MNKIQKIWAAGLIIWAIVLLIWAAFVIYDYGYKSGRHDGWWSRDSGGPMYGTLQASPINK